MPAPIHVRRPSWYSCCSLDARLVRGDTPQGSTANSKAITFESTDGVTLAGRLFGPDQGTAGVVLAHMLPSDQSAWYFFANRLGERGYRVLTFNFRGYCPGGEAGCSEGEKTSPRSGRTSREPSKR